MTLKEQLREVERQHFEVLDWSKSNNVLAAETGFSYVTIFHWRKVLGKPKVTKWFPACQAWDWTKRNVELAAEHRLSPTQVGLYRTQCGQPMVPRLTGRPAFAVKPKPFIQHVDWPSVDWTKTDIQLAMEVKRTRESVRLWRAKLGKPISPYKWRHRKFIAFAETFKGRASLTYNEVQEVMLVSNETIRSYCAELGIPLTLRYRYFSHPWGEMNFQLPNLLLADIWHSNSGSIANRRSRYICPPPLFVCVKGRIPEQFKTLVEAERTKAAEYFAKEQQAA